MEHTSDLQPDWSGKFIMSYLPSRGLGTWQEVVEHTGALGQVRGQQEHARMTVKHNLEKTGPGKVANMNGQPGREYAHAHASYMCVCVSTR